MQKLFLDCRFPPARRYLKSGSTLKENARNHYLPASKIKKVIRFFEDKRETKITSEI